MITGQIPFGYEGCLQRNNVGNLNYKKEGDWVTLEFSMNDWDLDHDNCPDYPHWKYMFKVINPGLCLSIVRKPVYAGPPILPEELRPKKMKIIGGFGFTGDKLIPITFHINKYGGIDCRTDINKNWKDIGQLGLCNNTITYTIND